MCFKRRTGYENRKIGYRCAREKTVLIYSCNSYGWKQLHKGVQISNCEEAGNPGICETK